MTTPELQVRKIRIGDREYDKPFDPGCAACRSPWLMQIDEMLGGGYSTAAIRQFLKSRRPACPHPDILHMHIAHLAAPHQQMRVQLEASRVGDNPSLVRVPAATQALIQKGYERLASGEIEVSAKDMLKAMSLQLQIEKNEANSGVDAATYQAALMELVELVRIHLSPAKWREFVNDAYASPKLRAIITGQQAALPGKESEHDSPA